METPNDTSETRQAGYRIPLPPWDMYTAFVTLMIGYLLMPMLSLNVLTLISPFMDNIWLLLTEQVIILLTWVVIFIFLAWRYQVDILDILGLKPHHPWRYYVWNGLLLLMVMLTWVLLINVVSKAFSVEAEQPFQEYSKRDLQVISVFAIMMAPLLEEVIFRGLVQSTFHRIASPTRAWIFTAFLFVLFHGLYFGNAIALTYVTVLALVFGYFRERTQSIIPGVMGHFLNNLIASVLMLQR